MMLTIYVGGISERKLSSRMIAAYEAKLAEMYDEKSASAVTADRLEGILALLQENGEKLKSQQGQLNQLKGRVSSKNAAQNEADLWAESVTLPTFEPINTNES